MSWFQNFKRNFCNYAKYEKQIDELKEDVQVNQDLMEEKAETIELQDKQLTKLKEERDIYYKKSEEAIEDLNNVGLNPIDSYCKRKGYPIDNFAYKDKVIINGIKIPCNLREMITPNSFVVEKARRSINKPENKLLWYQRVMNKVADMVEWTDDGRDDNFFYPAYTLQVGRADCEDHAFAQCSIEPELGTAFGFWDRGDNKPIGHAFAVGIVDNELWIFDAVPNQSVKSEGSSYSINYIITKNSIYVVDSGVIFGSILYG